MTVTSNRRPAVAFAAVFLTFFSAFDAASATSNQKPTLAACQQVLGERTDLPANAVSEVIVLGTYCARLTSFNGGTMNDQKVAEFHGRGSEDAAMTPAFYADIMEPFVVVSVLGNNHNLDCDGSEMGGYAYSTTSLTCIRKVVTAHNGRVSVNAREEIEAIRARILKEMMQQGEELAAALQSFSSDPWILVGESLGAMTVTQLITTELPIDTVVSINGCWGDIPPQLPKQLPKIVSVQSMWDPVVPTDCVAETIADISAAGGEVWSFSDPDIMGHMRSPKMNAWICQAITDAIVGGRIEAASLQ